MLGVSPCCIPCFPNSPLINAFHDRSTWYMGLSLLRQPQQPYYVSRYIGGIWWYFDIPFFSSISSPFCSNYYMLHPDPILAFIRSGDCLPRSLCLTWWVSCWRMCWYVWLRCTFSVKSKMIQCMTAGKWSRREMSIYTIHSVNFYHSWFHLLMMMCIGRGGLTSSRSFRAEILQNSSYCLVDWIL